MVLIIDEYEIQKKVKDNDKAFLVEGALFTRDENYPVLSDWMVPDEPPCSIIPFNKLNEYTKKEISNSYICTYCRDEDFKRIYNNPKLYINLFKRCAGLIGFDFSVYSDMPIIKQKENINHNLELSFYYGMRNIPIIPNIRPGVDETKEDYYKAFPKNTLVSVGTYGFIKTNDEKKIFADLIEEIVNVLKPSGIVVYGSVDDKVFNSCYINNIPVYQYNSYTKERFKNYGK